MIFFLVPIYNESDNLPRLCSELRALELPDDRTYVFSDDGSSDNSREVIARLFSGTPYVIVGNHRNRGPGAAFARGFEWILSRGPQPTDLVVTLEADCTSDLEILPEMLMLAKMKYDLVLASVYAQGGGFEKTTLLRMISSAIANFGFRFLFGVKTLTLSSFYRVYRVSLLQKINNRFTPIIREFGFVCMLEILLKAIFEKARIIEVPMQLHSSKRTGKSKMKIARTTFRYFSFLLRVKLRGF